MLIKKIEDMDYYEILNIPINASLREIEEAYLLAIATYHKDSIASHSLVSEEERQVLLSQIEKAFQTLVDPEKRKIYDLTVLPLRPEARQKAYFRKSTAKIEIEDAEEKKGIWSRIKDLLSPRKKKESAPSFVGDESETSAKPAFLRGDYLKKVREHRGLTLEKLADETKLTVSQLRALEEENYDILPKGKTLSNLLKLYARCLGIDSQEDQGNNS